jgi:hypothetical protein
MSIVVSLGLDVPVWGTGGPEFKSRRSDQQNQRLSDSLESDDLPRNRHWEDHGKMNFRGKGATMLVNVLKRQ